MKEIVAGFLVAGHLVVAAFFLRFWQRTRDRLFGYFAVAFVFLAVERMIAGLDPHLVESTPIVYGIRLIAFVLILEASWRRTPSGAKCNVHS